MTAVESTRVRALREAKGLLQSVGFNGFSFQHIADLLGIKKPSLYDHFKSKEELGQELIRDYQQSFVQWAETVSVFEPKDRIGALFEIFFKFSSNAGRICPLSAMIADYHAVPEGVRDALAEMYRVQHKWLKQTIEEGQKKKAFRKDRSSKELADLVLSIAFGSQLVARVTESPANIKAMRVKALEILEAN